MKIWKGYGSEHSMNLVMIGHFMNANDAEEAKGLIDQITNQATVEESRRDDSESRDRFSDEMLEFLSKAKLYSISPTEIEQFLYDAKVDLNDKQVTITTDEIDVLAFLKILLDRGARVEVYSAHDYPNIGHGR